MAQSFADIVAVLMRDPEFRQRPIADLEWLVIPPVLSGQFRLGHTVARPPAAKAAYGVPGKTDGGVLVPAAVALWASVSPAIDKRLSENLDQPLQLKPTEWATGDQLWLLAVAGARRGLPAFVRQLEKDAFIGRSVKLRTTDAAGKAVVKTLSPVN